MTHLDDFDDDETVIHGVTNSPAGDDTFDDDDTFLAPTSLTTQTVRTQEVVDLSDLELGASVTREIRSGPTAPPVVPSIRPTTPEPARSLQDLQNHAPLGPGWRPPDRPTSYAGPANQSDETSSGLVRLGVIFVILALIGGAVAVGAWLSITDPGESGEPAQSTDQSVDTDS